MNEAINQACDGAEADPRLQTVLRVYKNGTIAPAGMITHLFMILSCK